MPNCIQKPFIVPLLKNDYCATVENVKQNFDNLQLSIKEFVSANTAIARSKQLMDIISSIEGVNAEA